MLHRRTCEVNAVPARAVFRKAQAARCAVPAGTPVGVCGTSRMFRSL